MKVKRNLYMVLDHAGRIVKRTWIARDGIRVAVENGYRLHILVKLVEEGKK